VQADLSNDIGGNSRGGDGVHDKSTVRVFSEGTKATETPQQANRRRYNGGEIDSPSRNIARLMAALAERHLTNLRVEMVYRTDRYGRGGDQVPFLDAGFPAVRVTEAHQDYTRQHQGVRVENGVRYGGAHADNHIDMQEFMIVPVGAPRFSEAIQWGVEVFHALKGLLRSRGLSTAVGDEGGFAPDLSSNAPAIEIILVAIEQAGFRPGRDIALGLDVASSEFHKAGAYELASEGRKFDSPQFVDYLSRWVDAHPIVTIEDGMAEDDWDGWELLTAKLGRRAQLVGDDLFITNTEILQQGISRGAAHSILIKPNQIGTLSETLAAIAMAERAGYASVVLQTRQKPLRHQRFRKSAELGRVVTRPVYSVATDRSGIGRHGTGGTAHRGHIRRRRELNRHRFTGLSREEFVPEFTRRRNDDSAHVTPASLTDAAADEGRLRELVAAIHDVVDEHPPRVGRRPRSPDRPSRQSQTGLCRRQGWRSCRCRRGLRRASRLPKLDTYRGRRQLARHPRLPSGPASASPHKADLRHA